MGPHTPRSRETDAFLESRQQTPADIVSACDGWTAHEITAHLMAAAAEVIRHLEPHLAGEPVPATRSFEEREPPYRAMNDQALCDALVPEEARVRALIDEAVARDPEATIPWTGRQMPVAKFLPHLRSELAIHRWDIVGDDDISTELLGQADLTGHAVGVLGEMLLLSGRARDPAPGEDLHVRLRSNGAADVRLVVENGHPSLQLTDEQGDEPYVELDAAARTLVIWGRRPDHRGRFRSHLSESMLTRVQLLLSGY